MLKGKGGRQAWGHWAVPWSAQSALTVPLTAMEARAQGHCGGVVGPVEQQEVQQRGGRGQGQQAWLLPGDNAFSSFSLTKDMTGKEDNYRGPAVRALCQITDVSSPAHLPTWCSLLCPLPPLDWHQELGSGTGLASCSVYPRGGLTSLPPHVSPQSTMLQAIERYMKQAIVDKVPSVSSSALVSSLVGIWGAETRLGDKRKYPKCFLAGK